MRERVLIVDDQAELRVHLSELISSRGKDVKALPSAEEAFAILASSPEPFDLVILDLDLGPGRMNGLEALAQLRKERPDLPVIILTGHGTVDAAVSAIKAGAADFLEKDVHLDDRVGLSVEKLERIIASIRDNRRLQGENRYLRAERDRAHTLVAGAGLAKVMQQVDRVAKVPRPVLVLGERGTGKEHIAWEIHRRSPRLDGPFVEFNCAAVPETLVDSELFGHEKGAFTGATTRKAGRFELADKGTLFLDEVADMSEAFQAKVLRALEYQKFERVAGTASVEVDVRVVAATNADLDRRMADGKFRRDLYDRLAFEVIRIPPLRERKEDIPELATHFLQRFAEEAGTKPRTLEAAASEALLAYDYPGNVRELKHVVERAAYRCDNAALTRDSVLSGLPGASSSAPTTETRPTTGSFAERVEQFEKEQLVSALRANKFSQKGAAEQLGLSYDQFRHMFRKYGLKDA